FRLKLFGCNLGRAMEFYSLSQTKTTTMVLSRSLPHGIEVQTRRPFMMIGFLTAILAFLTILLLESSPVLALEAIDEDVPTPSSVDGLVTPMDRSFQERVWRPGFFPWLKEELQDA